MAESTFRCFVAVAIPESVKGLLTAYVRQAAAAFPAWRFGAPANLHITLQFLGDVDRGRTSSLTSLISSAVKDVPIFGVELGEAGSFPERGAPRILHVAAGRGRQELVGLAGRVTSALQGAGFYPDKPFAPHITLGRQRQGTSGGAGDTASRWHEAFSRFRAANPPASWEVSEVLLMESILGPGGPTYISRGRSPLRSPA